MGLTDDDSRHGTDYGDSDEYAGDGFVPGVLADMSPGNRRRAESLAVQIYGALSAIEARTLGPASPPSLATCEQLPDPSAVQGLEKGGLSDPSSRDVLDLVFRVGVEDVDRAAQLARKVSRSSGARQALNFALEMEDGERRQKVVRLLEEPDAVVEAKNLATCGRQSVRLECPDEFGAGGCGHEENYVPIHCDSRLCPECMNRQIGEKVERYSQIVSKWSDPTFYTLTLKNSGDPVRDVDAAVGAFGRLRRRHIAPDGDGWHWHRDRGDQPATGWKSKLLRAGKHDLARQLQKKYVERGRQIPVDELIKGGIYSVDVKQKSPDEWNVHLHVLADAHWIPQAALSETWNDLTDSPVVDVRRIYGRGDDDVQDALLETVAYACKPPEFESIEDAVEYVSATKNRRFVQTFGETHGNVPELGGKLLCERCENTPAWWNYHGLVNDHIDNMGKVHGSDSHGPPESA